MRGKSIHRGLLAAGLLLALLASACGSGGLPAAPTAAPEQATAPATAPAATQAPTEALAPTQAPTETLAPTQAPTEAQVPTTAPADTATPTSPSTAAGTEIHQWASTAQASSQYGEQDWAAGQATGAPNTAECGDQATAWASDLSNGIDWLQLGYATPVRPTQVNIVESYNPNQVVKVELLDTAGALHTVFSAGPQPVEQCPYTLSIAVAGADYLAVGVKLTVDQSVRDQWNEIDAVELVGVAGTPGAVASPVPSSTPVAGSIAIREWASTAEASSQYGEEDWAAGQATGAPNTVECGDHPTAWASELSDSLDWLQLGYATPVRPTQVNIVETYNPSQVIKVELLDTAGVAHPVYSGQPQPIGQCPYTLSIAVAGADYLAIGVRVTIDQSVIGGWNEIDAVELAGWANP